jgi:iron complex outermembrane recepter protein
MRRYIQRLKVVTALISLVIISADVRSQQRKDGEVKGSIKTLDGQPAEYVNIGIKGVKGTTVDSKGFYILKNIPSGTYTLKASYVGMETQSREIVVVANKVTEVDFILNENNARLQEVVIKGNRTNKFSRKESEHVSKMPLRNLENPQVYHVVSKDLLAEQLIFTVDDAINNTPGIQKMWEATGRGGDGGSYYNSRGFIVQSALRNGIAGIVTSQTDAINLEKLEVIKGPSATLFGSRLSSYGGLLNRVTKKPFESLATEISLSGGSYDFHRVSADVNAPITSNKDLMFRLNTAYNYEGTFQEQGFNKSWAATPSFLYQPNDRLSISLDAELYYGKNTGKQAFFFYFPASALGASSPEELNLDYEKSYMGKGLSQSSRSTNFFGQVNYKLSGNWTSSTNFTSSNSYSNGFSPYFYLIPDNVVTENDADAGKANYLARADQSTGDSKYHVIEIQQNFNGDFNIGNLRNRLVVGFDFLRIKSDQNFFGSSFDIAPLNDPNFDFGSFNGSNMQAKYATGTPPDFTYPIVNKINTYSAFASNVLNVTNKFSILAALRVDRFDNKGGTEGGTVLPYKQTAFSPKFGVVYQLVKERVSLFANYQNGFNNKGSYNAYNTADPTKPLVVNAKPEQANQVEGGIKLDAFQGKLSGTVSYYSIKVQDLLRADPRAANIAQIQNGTQVSKGIEFDIMANPVTGLNVIAGFSYNDSKMEKADADVDGRRPATASSPYLANLWVSYRLPKNTIQGLGAGFGINYASENKILNSVSMGQFTLPSYTILGATVFYDKSRYRFGVKANNLTNEKYYIGYTTLNPQRLRNFAASISYKF